MFSGLNGASFLDGSSGASHHHQQHQQLQRAAPHQQQQRHEDNDTFSIAQRLLAYQQQQQHGGLPSADAQALDAFSLLARSAPHPDGNNSSSNPMNQQRHNQDTHGHNPYR